MSRYTFMLELVASILTPHSLRVLNVFIKELNYYYYYGDGLLVSSFSAWQRMSLCPNHEQPVYRVCEFVSPSAPLPACRCVFGCQ